MIIINAFLFDTWTDFNGKLQCGTCNGWYGSYEEFKDEERDIMDAISSGKCDDLTFYFVQHGSTTNVASNNYTNNYTTIKYILSYSNILNSIPIDELYYFVIKYFTLSFVLSIIILILLIKINEKKETNEIGFDMIVSSRSEKKKNGKDTGGSKYSMQELI